jgi:hypothetical protein
MMFVGQFDHNGPFRGDLGLRFALRETDRQDFAELNEVRRQIGLLVYREP